MTPEPGAYRLVEYTVELAADAWSEMVSITKVVWLRDPQRRAVLELEIDGHPVFIPGGQKSELLVRGIVEGLVFFAPERRDRLPNAFVQVQPEFGQSEVDSVRSTDDPQVFALYQDMCQAIQAGTWRAGRRSLPA